MRRQKVLTVALLVPVVACSLGLAVWGYLRACTDVLTLRQDPIQRVASPGQRWALRVYEITPGENGGSWLVTATSKGDPGAKERVVYEGDPVMFFWDTTDVLRVQEYPKDVPGPVHRIDVRKGQHLERDRPDERGLDFVLLIAAFAPSALVLAVGIPAAVLLPKLLWRHERERAP